MAEQAVGVVPVAERLMFGLRGADERNRPVRQREHVAMSVKRRERAADAKQRIVPMDANRAVRDAAVVGRCGNGAGRLGTDVLEDEDIGHRQSRSASARLDRSGTVSTGSACGVGGSNRSPYRRTHTHERPRRPAGVTS